MGISSKVEYAIVSLLEMASQYNDNKPVQIRQIAEKHQIPERYLEQVFALLRRAGIIQSQRGSKGGYLLTRSPWQITLFDILTCLEDAKLSKQTPSACSPNRSIIYEIWQEAQKSTSEVFQRYTLRDLCEQLEQRQQINTMYYI
jgi:Rrf2 family protein